MKYTKLSFNFGKENIYNFVVLLQFSGNKFTWEFNISIEGKGDIRAFMGQIGK